MSSACGAQKKRYEPFFSLTTDGLRPHEADARKHLARARADEAEVMLVGPIADHETVRTTAIRRVTVLPLLASVRWSHPGRRCRPPCTGAAALVAPTSEATSSSAAIATAAILRFTFEPPDRGLACDCEARNGPSQTVAARSARLGARAGSLGRRSCPLPNQSGTVPTVRIARPPLRGLTQTLQRDPALVQRERLAMPSS